MLFRSYFPRKLSGFFVLFSCAFAVLGFFSLASPARAAMCDCECGWGLIPTSFAEPSCTVCNSACHRYCFGVDHADTGYAGFGPQTSAGTCRIEPGTVTPSTVPGHSGSGGSGSGSGSGRRRTTSAGTSSGGTRTTAGTAGDSGGSGSTGSTGATGSSGASGAGSGGVPGSTGVCSFNCMTPRLTACNTNDDCHTLCTSQCPTLVGGNATCATNPAPRCVTAVDGTKNCAFECVVTPQESCQVGDAGNIQCGTRSLAVCAPPAGAGTTAPTINVSTIVQPRCIAPPGSSNTAGDNSGSGTPDSGSSGSGSGSGGSGTSASYHLRNPIQGANTIPQIIGKAVRAVMGLVGAIALLMFILGGIRWILAAGDSKEVQAASDLLKNATIGLLIIFLSYTVITVGMGLVNDLAGQGSSSGTTQSSP